MINKKNPSDHLFERYLSGRGFSDVSYERDWSHTEKKPDYSITSHNQTLIFDVKEFDKRDLPVGFSYSDPYKPIRSKINDAARQFKPFKGKFCCSVVLYSERPDIILSDNIRMLGAMYGEVSLKIPFDNSSGTAYTDRQEIAFHKKGKMFHFESNRPQNTTVSSVISLFNLNDQVVASHLSRTLSDGEMEEIELDPKRVNPSGSPFVIVWQNVFAEKPFPNSLFNGPFDQRWGLKGDRIERVFAGKGIKAIEKLDHKL